MANRNFLAYFFPESNNMSLLFNKEKFELSSFFKKIFWKNFQNLPKLPQFTVLSWPVFYYKYVQFLPNFLQIPILYKVLE